MKTTRTIDIILTMVFLLIGSITIIAVATNMIPDAFRMLTVMVSAALFIACGWFLCRYMIRDDADDDAVDNMDSNETIDNPVNENVEPERHSVLSGIMRGKMKTDKKNA